MDPDRPELPPTALPREAIPSRPIPLELWEDRGYDRSQPYCIIDEAQLECECQPGYYYDEVEQVCQAEPEANPPDLIFPIYPSRAFGRKTLLIRGELSHFGYRLNEPDEVRWAALAEAVEAYGYLPVIRKVTFIHNINASPYYKEILRRDMDFLMANFGSRS